MTADHYKAYIHTRAAGENLLLAHAASPEEFARGYHENQAKAAFQAAAEALGYELVKREKQEAA
jgi:hypothetical protein